MGEEKGNGESPRERVAAVGENGEGVENGKRELEGLEEEAGGAGGEDAHPLRQLVEGPNQLHHHLPPRLLQCLHLSTLLPPLQSTGNRGKFN